MGKPIPIIDKSTKSGKSLNPGQKIAWEGWQNFSFLSLLKPSEREETAKGIKYRIWLAGGFFLEGAFSIF
ncbi:MAG: hypothetical protein HXY45_18435 [Syntrophaceae bacterium]|nr:hypothetical protein [Syntrophaceae bacterium]